MSCRIALVTPILPMPFDPTRGRFIYETAKALAELTPVRAFLQQAKYPDNPQLKPRSYIYEGLSEDYCLPDLDVEAFNYPAFPLVSRGLNGFVSSHYLSKRIKRFKPDIIIGYWVYPDGFAALRCARQLGVPCVIGALGSDIHLRSGINAYLTKRTLCSADAVIVVSEAMRQFTIQEFGAPSERVHTIVNGFNTEVFYPQDRNEVRLELGIACDSELIVYVGRFIEAKGLIELIQAFSEISSHRPQARLALVGSGVLEQRLRQLIADLGLAEKVLLPGGLQPHQVAKWIAASQLLTLPSWSEGYPNVVVEGVACGRPVVATDVGGTREIINADNGILIQPRRADLLAAALDQCLNKQWDHEGIARSIQRSWRDVATETLTICTDLAEKTSALRAMQ